MKNGESNAPKGPINFTAPMAAHRYLFPKGGLIQRGALGCLLLAASSTLAAPTTRPALEQLSAETKDLYQQVQRQVVRVETPVPDWMLALAARDNPLTKWGQLLDAAVQQELAREKLKPFSSHRLSAELAPARGGATKPATQAASSEPAAPVAETESHPGAILTIRTPGKRAATTQFTLTSAKVNTLGVILNKEGYVLIPLYLEKQAAGRGSITIYNSDGTSCVGKFIGSDQKTNVTVVQMEKILGVPATLENNRPDVGSLVMILTPNRASAHLTIWTGANQDFGIVAGMDGRIFGIVHSGQLLAPPVFSPIVRQLIATGQVKRATLGVWITEVHPGDPLRQSIPALGNRPAIIVERVEPGSAAEKAGIQPGDLIIRFAGESVEDAPAFAAAIADRTGPTDLEILRDGKPIRMQVTLVAK